jgi:hypothetical protein
MKAISKILEVIILGIFNKIISAGNEKGIRPYPN